MTPEAQAFEQRKAETGSGFPKTANQQAMEKAKRLILDQGYDWDTAITMACNQHEADPQIVWYMVKADQSPRNPVTGKIEKAW